MQKERDAMNPVGHFILAVLVAATALAGGSLVWPKLTTRERPKLLQDVHNIVVRTSAGNRAAQVLGVSDERDVQPINLGEVASTVATSAKNAVNQRIQTVIVKNAVNQLDRQFDKLPPEQQTYIQEVLCRSDLPVASSAASATESATPE